MQYLTRLDAPALRDLGVPEPWDYGIADRVRFSEIDSLGHVNNVAYIRWFETIRVRWMKDMGLMGRRDVQSVVRAQAGEYFAPMFMDADYVVTTRAATVGATSLRKDYAVWAEGALKASGWATVVTVDPAGTRKVPVPEDIRALLLGLGAEDTRRG